MMRNKFKRDLAIAAIIWPISQLRELLSYAFYMPLGETAILGINERGFIVKSVLEAADSLPETALQQIYDIARTMAIGGVLNWELPDAQQRLDSGEDPFQMLENYLKEVPGINNFDELAQIRDQNSQN